MAADIQVKPGDKLAANASYVGTRLQVRIEKA
jgi:hypothetical protein